ncbi:hypothetical protein PROFUN_00953 [Planoprotostelium fungivorum]|uniref:Uncharacterized protein n=1 Tax=Planoprotostelium fungivorum TaxID=1890364 RepID=A0A2P6N4A2_9EUKA|nr:hypothetical protein PROFUN_00953 [Planoprotostelium fungivorum]
MQDVAAQPMEEAEKKKSNRKTVATKRGNNRKRTLDDDDEKIVVKRACYTYLSLKPTPRWAQPIGSSEYVTEAKTSPLLLAEGCAPLRRLNNK